MNIFTIILLGIISSLLTAICLKLYDIEELLKNKNNNIEKNEGKNYEK